MNEFRVPMPKLDISQPDSQAVFVERSLAAIAEAERKSGRSAPELLLWKSLTQGQRAAWALTMLEMEVNSGGFDRYFRYSGADTCVEAVLGLQEIGAGHVLAILQKAVGLFPKGRPSDDVDERSDEVDWIDENRPGALPQLDGAFFEAYDCGATITKLLTDWMVKNPREFFTT